MKSNFKRIFATLTASICLFSSINVYAKTSSIVFYNKDVESSVVSSIPGGATSISVNPSTDSLTVGQDFYVDFVIENNPGFAAYGFTIDYDPAIVTPVKGDEDELDSVVQVTYGSDNYNAIPTRNINKAIDISKNSGSIYSNNILLEDGSPVNSSGNGILFRMQFRAVGVGEGEITLSDRLKALLTNSDVWKIPTYIQNASITVSSSGSSDNTTETTTETTTTATATVSTNKAQTTTTTTEATSVATTETEETEQTTENNISDSKNDTNGFDINLPKDVVSSRDFEDISSVPWAERAINNLSSLGIINGVDDVTFNPKAYTCRADFVLVITRLLGLDGQADNVFDDIDGDEYFAKAVSIANKFDIVSGNNGMFMPKNNITRQDAMLILSRVLQKAGKLQSSDENIVTDFDDFEQISDYAKSAVADLVGMKIVKGDNDNMLNPKGNINRAEMAVLIDRIYDILND